MSTAGEIETVDDKEHLRAQIKRDIDEFLARGGEIKQLPIIVGNHPDVHTQIQKDMKEKRGRGKQINRKDLVL